MQRNAVERSTHCSSIARHTPGLSLPASDRFVFQLPLQWQNNVKPGMRKRENSTASTLEGEKELVLLSFGEERIEGA